MTHRGVDAETEDADEGEATDAGDGDEVAEDGDSDGEQVELDFYAGVTGELPIGAGVDWDAGVIYYAFPWAVHSSDHDFVEVFVGLSYGFVDQLLELEVGIRVYHSLDYAAGSGQDTYTDGSVGFSLPYDVDLGLHVGY